MNKSEDTATYQKNYSQHQIDAQYKQFLLEKLFPNQQYLSQIPS